MQEKSGACDTSDRFDTADVDFCLLVHGADIEEAITYSNQELKYDSRTKQGDYSPIVGRSLESK